MNKKPIAITVTKDMYPCLAVLREQWKTMCSMLPNMNPDYVPDGGMICPRCGADLEKEECRGQ